MQPISCSSVYIALCHLCGDAIGLLAIFVLKNEFAETQIVRHSNVERLTNKTRVMLKAETITHSVEQYTSYF